MTLCDTGPLVALVNTSDEDHARCAEALDHIPGPLLTTWPCFTEAMYLSAREAKGRQAEAAVRRELWNFVRGGLLDFHEADSHEVSRMMELMERYHDRPMDLADASIVAAAEALKQRVVFSIDGDFYIYRLTNGSFPDVIPGSA